MDWRGLFVSDLDGTLLASDGSLPEVNRVAVRDATAAGVAFAVVTGRRRSSVDRSVASLDGLPYRLATSNGAVILGDGRQVVEAVHSLPWEMALGLAVHPELVDCTVMCITAPADPTRVQRDCFVRLPGVDDWLSSLTPYDPTTLLPVGVDEVTARPLVHVALRVADRARARWLAARLGPDLPPSSSVHVVRSPVGPGALTEIVPRGGKGLAVIHLARSFGVDVTATGAIGDELNDGDLLDAAHHRYAVGGSVLADERTDAVVVSDADDGAVADALARFVKALESRPSARAAPTRG